ncbi:MAG: acetate--CoA ligase family protein [Deltaproteobacteria bacterium]|nr:acetate--CoA ligase family protein [Deltaproteobacteria bacterium]
MQNNPLKEIMNPKSVAMVGASGNPAKMGTLQLLNIVYGGWGGEILVVHPTEKEVLGNKAYPSISELPYAPEMAMLVVPTRLVPDMLEDFGRLGTKRAVIITAGFAETGDGGRELQARILDIAAKYGMRFLGPNCMGIINAHAPFNATVTPLQNPPGHFSLASQSGTYAAQTLGYLAKRGIRLAKAISVGNEASIDLVDCLEYLGEDPETRAIGMYIESIRRPREFLDAARRISRKKPIVAQYVGGTAAGARSGSSHTGALAGPDYVIEGLFAQAGIIRASSIEEVYFLGHTLASAPPLSGKNIAVLTNSGGPGTAMADTCERAGLSVPELPPAVQARLRELLAPHASVKNPVDLTFHIDMDLLVETLPELLFESDAVDGLLVHGVMGSGWAELAHKVFEKAYGFKKEDMIKGFTRDLSRLTAMPAKYRKPLLVSSFMDSATDSALKSFQQAGVPTFDAPEKAARAMGALWAHAGVRARHGDEVRLMQTPAKAAELVQNTAPDAWDEHLAKKVLAAYGIPVCREMAAHTADQAMDAAREIGFPVAVKALSPAISHKTEMGLVHLSVADEGGVRAAFSRIQEQAGPVPVLVCEMLPTGREFLAGAVQQPGFGPVVLFGAGGVLAEALGDRIVRMAPLSSFDARDMIASIRSQALLGPFRGMDPVDTDALAELLVRLSHLAAHFPRIREIDANPVLIKNGKPVVADALFKVS